MQIKFTKTKKALLLVTLFTLFMSPQTLWAMGGYDIYFLGVNIETMKGSNWMKVAAGAAASILTHELGHALYLESQGKDWEFGASSSGLAVTTTNSLTDSQYQGLGRSGYLLQTGIGFLLATFDATAKSDFTKGWVGVNVVQTLSYNWRGHDLGDDFDMIDRGHGNSEASFNLFSAMSLYNFLKANSYNESVIYRKGYFQKAKTPLKIETSVPSFNEDPNSLIFSMNIKTAPSVSTGLFLENTTQPEQIGVGQRLAFLR